MAIRLLTSVADVDRVPLEPNQAEAMLKVGMIQMSSQSIVGTAAELESREGKPPFELGVMLRRLAVMSPDAVYDYYMVVFLGIVARNIAEAIMWSLLLKHRTEQLGHVYTTQDFAEDFPFGVPSEAATHRLWVAQKTAKGNLIDTPEPWVSGYFDAVEAA